MAAILLRAAGIAFWVQFLASGSSRKESSRTTVSFPLEGTIEGSTSGELTLAPK